MKLSSPVTELRGVGPAKAQQLKKLGITHVRDLLYTFPRRYDDFSNITHISELKVGEKMTVQGTIRSATSNWGFQGRRRILRIFVEVEDATGVLAVMWYNLRFLLPHLREGREIFVAGTVEENSNRKNVQPVHRMRSPVIEFGDNAHDHTHTGRITPVYPETHGVTSRFLRYQIKSLLPLLQVLPEYLPEEIRGRHNLIGIKEAITTVHFPDSTEDLKQAQTRLRFDELFFLQLAALVRRQKRERRQAYQIVISKKETKQWVSQLSFQLTSAQTKALQEIVGDLKKEIPMNRLLQGDVGSGKSAVALLATQAVLDKNFTVLYLAPTEVLARQQAESFSKALGPERVALLIGALREKEKQQIKQRIASDEALCVIGTHALLQEDVLLQRCALVIVDEQHRFGVKQRQALQTPNTDGVVPHLLSMTATPIPRTLNLTVYGDLDVSILDELPPGRKPITTTIVAPTERDQAIIHILEELHRGRQAYVIAPLVEESEVLEAKSAKVTFAEMQQLFPDIAVGLLHGKMSSSEKESVLRSFTAGAIQLLVATAVVEVGVNVPNATIMIIEGAERFGLAQLHQFRGRVGRGEHQSYCYLFPTTAQAAVSRRLKILEKTTDGFVIAEEDLKLRGPGEVYGVSQSGFGDLKVASLLDYPTIKAARTEAMRLLQEDPSLEKYPILKGKVEQKNLITHFE